MGVCLFSHTGVIAGDNWLFIQLLAHTHTLRHVVTHTHTLGPTHTHIYILSSSYIKHKIPIERRVTFSRNENCFIFNSRQMMCTTVHVVENKSCTNAISHCWHCSEFCLLHVGRRGGSRGEGAWRTCHREIAQCLFCPPREKKEDHTRWNLCRHTMQTFRCCCWFWAGWPDVTGRGGGEGRVWVEKGDRMCPPPPHTHISLLSTLTSSNPPTPPPPTCVCVCVWTRYTRRKTGSSLSRTPDVADCCSGTVSHWFTCTGLTHTHTHTHTHCHTHTPFTSNTCTHSIYTLIHTRTPTHTHTHTDTARHVNTPTFRHSPAPSYYMHHSNVYLWHFSNWCCVLQQLTEETDISMYHDAVSSWILFIHMPYVIH